MLTRLFLVCSLCGVLLGCQPAATAPAVPETPKVAAPVAAKESFQIESGFTAISFESLALYPDEEATRAVWKAEGEEILCAGKPKCYLYTKAAFGNGTLRYDFRFEPDPTIKDPIKLDGHNTGVLLFIQEPHGIWPKSIEVQGKQIEMGQLRPNGGATPVAYEDFPKVRLATRKPLGEWNSMEVVTRDGAITVVLNGKIVADGKPGELKSGLIALQAEGYKLRYRRLRFAPPAE